MTEKYNTEEIKKELLEIYGNDYSKEINDIYKVYFYEWNEDNYEGWLKVIYSKKDDDKNYYEVFDAHCSCYGLECFEPEPIAAEIFAEYMKKMGIEYEI